MQVYVIGEVALVNAYVPYANINLEGAVDYRKKWNRIFIDFIKKLSSVYYVIICGDLNIVHTEFDTTLKLEQNKPGYTKWERDDFNDLLQNCELRDAFRDLHPSERVATSYGNYRHLGFGARIDYFLVSKHLLVAECEILKDFEVSQSDPILLKLE